MQATSNTKILVTGSTGFIGSHLVPRLIADGFQVVLLGRMGSFEKTKKFDSLPTILDPGDVDSLATTLKSQSIHGVIHLASCYLKNHKPNQLSELLESNVHFPTRLIEACSINKVKWFLNIGTIWQNYENQSYNPVNLYSATKQAYQDILLFYSTVREIKVLTLKLSDTYGPDDPRPKILNLLELAARSNKTIDMSGGEQVLDLLYIEDVISGILRGVDLLNHETKENQLTYCLRANEKKTLREIAELFQVLMNKKININWGALPYSKREIMIPPTADEVLPGWAPKYNLEDGLKKLLLN